MLCGRSTGSGAGLLVQTTAEEHAYLGLINRDFSISKVVGYAGLFLVE